MTCICSQDALFLVHVTNHSFPAVCVYLLFYSMSKRNDYKADLVQFIVDGRLIPDAGCGIGMLGNWAGYIPFTITDPILAYSVVDATCTDTFTPVHEWGHNMVSKQRTAM